MTTYYCNLVNDFSAFTLYMTIPLNFQNYCHALFPVACYVSVDVKNRKNIVMVSFLQNCVVTPIFFIHISHIILTHSSTNIFLFTFIHVHVNIYCIILIARLI